jgi:hypothetical protein
MTTTMAIKKNDTVYVIDPTQIRWFEYSERHGDLTLFYHNGAMETIRHSRAHVLFRELQLQFNVLDVDDY